MKYPRHPYEIAMKYPKHKNEITKKYSRHENEISNESAMKYHNTILMRSPRQFNEKLQ